MCRSWIRDSGRDRHLTASIAIFKACLLPYFPCNMGPMICLSFFLSIRNGNAHSCRSCCLGGHFLSIARKPVSNSIKTTPKLYTSLFTYSFPNKSHNINIMEKSSSLYPGLSNSKLTELGCYKVSSKTSLNIEKSKF